MPTLLEMRTYRFMGHSMSDAVSGTYRTKAELEEYMKRDPITLLRTHMQEAGELTDESSTSSTTRSRRSCRTPGTSPTQSPEPPLEALYEDVLVDTTSDRRAERPSLPTDPQPDRSTDSECPSSPTATPSNQALREEMQRDDRVFLMGEEVAVYQGAYKVSKGLLQEFGEMRVVDTPITELGFAGVGVGAAMVGLRPIIEFMTWNFALLALDQVVNAAAKMLYMSGGQYNIPIVFRGPNGAALQLSAQHSQAWESLARAHPGPQGRHARARRTTRRACSRARSATTTRCASSRARCSTTPRAKCPTRSTSSRIGKADLKREGEHCSIITHGKMVLVAMQAADQLAKEGINVDVVDLRTVRPMDVEAIATSVQKTNRAVVLEEGWEICGVGAQVVDYIQRECFDYLDAPVIRVHQADVPMPYAKNLEKAAKPDAAEDDRRGSQSHVPRLT